MAKPIFNSKGEITMAKPIFNSKNEAQMEIERCLAGIELIKNMCGGRIAEPETVNAIGRALMDHFHTVCEGILYRICSELATFDGKVEWPSLKDLRKKREYVHAPIEVGLAAEAMAKAKNACDKAFVTSKILNDYFSLVRIFIPWAKEMLKSFGDAENEAIRAINELEKFIDKWDVYIEEIEEMERDKPPYGLYLRYHGNIDIDNMTDEELDKLYRRRMSNSRKSLAPVFIYRILQEHPDKHFLIKDIQDILKENHEIDLGRNAVLRHLNTMIEDDINIWGSDVIGVGYWYSEQRPEGYDY